MSLVPYVEVEVDPVEEMEEVRQLKCVDVGE